MTLCEDTNVIVGEEYGVRNRNEAINIERL